VRFIPLLFLFTGCAAFTNAQQKAWARIPDYMLKACDRYKNAMELQEGKDAISLITCKDAHHCACTVVIK
jgi:hypothetical protein